MINGCILFQSHGCRPSTHGCGLSTLQRQLLAVNGVMESTDFDRKAICEFSARLELLSPNQT